MVTFFMREHLQYTHTEFLKSSCGAEIIANPEEVNDVRVCVCVCVCVMKHSSALTLGVRCDRVSPCDSDMEMTLSPRY